MSQTPSRLSLNSGSSSESPNSGQAQEVYSPILSDPENFLDRFAHRVADLCSPIVLKQVRQSVKSRVFLITFHLLLACCVLWTALCYVYGANVGQNIDALSLLTGYSVIFGFPMMIVIPSVAYHNISVSFRDNTFDLLSITTTSSRGLIYGTFSSNLLQGLVYFGGVFPCIAFCFILHGIDIKSIFLVTTSAFAISMLLSSFGIMLACLCSTRIASIVARLALFLLCLICMFWWGTIGLMGFIYGMEDFNTIPIAVFVWVYFASFTLMFLFLECGIGLIGFLSENRSYVLRLAVHLPIIVIWLMTVDLVMRETTEINLNMLAGMGAVFQVFVSHYWVIVGAVMCSERHNMSKRVQRSLPNSFWANITTSLLYPGFGRGYLYSLIALVSWNLSAIFLPAFIFTVVSIARPDTLSVNITQLPINFVIYTALINIAVGGMFLSFIYLVNRFFVTFTGNSRILTSIFVLILSYVIYGLFFAMIANMAFYNYLPFADVEDVMKFSWWRASFPTDFGASYNGYTISITFYVVLLGYSLIFFLLCRPSLSLAWKELFILPIENEDPISE